MKTKIMLFFLLISTTIFGQNGQKSVTDALNAAKKIENASYFEVSGEMFRMMAETEGINEEYKNYISKLSNLKMVRGERVSSQGNDLHYIFMLNVNLKDYSMLMTSTQPDRNISFYKKENKNSEKEYLLVSNDIIIYLTGTIDIKSLQEMEGIMNIAGSAMGM